MRTDQNSGATTAPPSIQNLQAARIRARIRSSAAVASLLASLAFGAARRDDDVLLWAVTAERVGAGCW